jgi:hypothetical protein
MTMVALICAYQEAEPFESSPPDDGLRATLPLAGRSLAERQARLAVAAGATAILFFIDRLPPALLSAIERLRGEGLAVSYARTPLEAAQAVQAEDRLLLIADGFVADEVHLHRLVTEGSGILTLPDLGVDERFERIDAQSRWAGLALVTGQLLKQTAMMIKDWDLQSTLLRRAVQSGIREFSVRELSDAHLNIVTRRSELLAIEQQIFEESVARRDSWVSRYVLAVLEQAATKLLMPTTVPTEALNLTAVLLNALAAFLFAYDWFWTPGILLLLSTPLDDIADRLASLRMQSRKERTWWTYLLPATSAAALLTLSYSLGGQFGWGCLPIGAATLAFVGALWLEVGEHEIEGQIFLAERKGMVWIMLLFAITGSRLAGLFGLSIYAAGSFFWAQHQIHHRIGR